MKALICCFISCIFLLEGNNAGESFQKVFSEHQIFLYHGYSGCEIDCMGIILSIRHVLFPATCILEEDENGGILIHLPRIKTYRLALRRRKCAPEKKRPKWKDWFSRPPDSSKASETFYIHAVHPHPDFNWKSKNPNAALIVMDRRLYYIPQYKPSRAYPTSPLVGPQPTGTCYTYGQHKEMGERLVNIPFTSNENCPNNTICGRQKVKELQEEGALWKIVNNMKIRVGQFHQSFFF